MFGSAFHKAANVHAALNKEKLLIILYTSKTHGKNAYPQEIKITSNKLEKSGAYFQRHFCPFKVVKKYIRIRGNFASINEPFFIYSDKSPVKSESARALLRQLIKELGLVHQCHLYDMHSLRIGRCSDLIKYGYSIQQVQKMGRWKSNAVYKYIRN